MFVNNIAGLLEPCIAVPLWPPATKLVTLIVVVVSRDITTKDQPPYSKGRLILWFESLLKEYKRVITVPNTITILTNCKQ